MSNKDLQNRGPAYLLPNRETVSRGITIFRTCRLIIEEKHVNAVGQPNFLQSFTKSFLIGALPHGASAFMKKPPGMMLNSGMHLAGNSSALVAFKYFNKPTKKCVSDIMRDELTEAQQEEFIKLVEPIFADIPIDEQHYLLNTSLDRKYMVIQKTQSFLKEKLGYKEFTSSLTID